MNIRQIHQIVERYRDGETLEEIGNSLAPPRNKSTIWRWVCRHGADQDRQCHFCNKLRKKTKSPENVLMPA